LVARFAVERPEVEVPEDLVVPVDLEPLAARLRLRRCPVWRGA
jgi:hypothetical protein